MGEEREQRAELDRLVVHVSGAVRARGWRAGMPKPYSMPAAHGIHILYLEGTFNETITKFGEEVRGAQSQRLARECVCPRSGAHCDSSSVSKRATMSGKTRRST